MIVGFTRDRGVKQRLWDYPHARSESVEQVVETGINAYLVDGPNTLVAKRSKPLAAIPPARFGSKPVDGGELIVETGEYGEVAADPVAAKYLRPFRMGRELVRGLDRWCLWMADEFDPADLSRSPILKKRVEAVRTMRLNSKKVATQLSASTPYLFQENHQPETNYVGIPAVVSQTRNFYAAAHLPPEVIAGNKLYVADDPEGLLFGLISSSMFITWQRAVGGVSDA